MGIPSLEKIIERLKSVKKYKDYTDEAIMKLAEAEFADRTQYQKLENKLSDIDIESMFLSEEEKKTSRLLLRKYINTYTIETISEENILKQLVFLEVFNNRLQGELNQYHQSNQPSPVKTIEALHSNLNQISELKERLGLFKSDKAEKDEGYAIIDTLFKKWKIWRQENSGSRSLICPHCQKMVLLKIRTEAWEAQKHPFFKDRILTNHHLMLMLRLGQITKRDVALVLGTSIDYISWLIKKVYAYDFKDTKIDDEAKPKELEIIAEDEIESGTIVN